MLGCLGGKGKKDTPAHQEGQTTVSHTLAAAQPPAASPADSNLAPLSQEVSGTLPCTHTPRDSLLSAPGEYLPRTIPRVWTGSQV